MKYSILLTYFETRKVWWKIYCRHRLTNSSVVGRSKRSSRGRRRRSKRTHVGSNSENVRVLSRCSRASEHARTLRRCSSKNVRVGSGGAEYVRARILSDRFEARRSDIGSTPEDGAGRRNGCRCCAKGRLSAEYRSTSCSLLMQSTKSIGNPSNVKLGENEKFFSLPALCQKQEQIRIREHLQKPNS